MIDRVSFYLFTGLIGVSFLGCNSGGDFKSGAAIGVSRNDKSKDDKKDDEDDTADEPVEVSGSFLTCAFMDSETSVVDKAKTDPQGNLEIACGLFRQLGDTFGRVDDSKLKLQSRILTNKGKLIPAEFRRLLAGSQMQVITRVPVEQLSGTIHIDYYDPSNGSYSSRRKSIPSITEFTAKVGFNVNDDDSVQRFVTGQFVLNGSLDPADNEIPEQKVNWWDIVIPIIVQVFGPQASVPASNDNGATVYQPKPQNMAQARPATNTNNNSTGPSNYPKKPSNQPTKPLPPVLDTSVKQSTDDNFEKVDMSKNKPDSQVTPPTSGESNNPPVSEPDPAPQNPEPQNPPPAPSTDPASQNPPPQNPSPTTPSSSGNE